MSIDRRKFIAQSAAVIGGLGAAAASDAGGQGQAPLLDAAIPSSGERIPRIGLGTWRGFDVGADTAARAELAAALQVFSASGARMIDTSPMYQSSELVLGDLLAAARMRDRVFLATKVWTSGRDPGVRQMRDSLSKLRSSRVELMQIHNLLDWRTHLRTLRAWKDDGRIRYIGITHYQASSHAEVARILRDEQVDFLQLNLSLDEPEAAPEILALCARRGVAFIANRPFGGGGAFGRTRGKPLPPWVADYDIASWAQFLLKWVLSHEEVTVAIPGTSDPRHMADNLGAGRGRVPDARGRLRMAEVWRSL
jgi:diketogulonate reductase-like aldo/keto reductase